MPNFHLLGPLEIRRDDGVPVPLVRRKQRALLSLLLLRAGTDVTVDGIVDALWGEQPPASARANIYSYVSELRRAIHRAAPSVATRRPRSTPNGYRLDLLTEESDAALFERLAADGRRSLAARRPAEAAECLARALGLWRGAMLAGIEDAWVTPHVARLNQARMGALEDQTEARLTLGQHRELSVELAAEVQRHPFQERLWGQFIVALHRSGRRTEALRAYEHFTVALDTELGIRPGHELAALHQDVLFDEFAHPAGQLRRLATFRDDRLRARRYARRARRATTAPVAETPG